MRQLVISGILDYKKMSNGFNPNNMRWNRGSRKHPNDAFCVNGVHFSEVNWDDPTITDDQLIAAFTTIVRQSTSTKQM